MHQPYGGVQGQISDIEIQAEEILRNREVLNQIIAKHSGQSIEKIAKDTDRDFFLGAEEAKAYGIVDDILAKTALPRKTRNNCSLFAPSSILRLASKSRTNTLSNSIITNINSQNIFRRVSHAADSYVVEKSGREEARVTIFIADCSRIGLSF